MDHRPQLERTARRALHVGALVILGCMVLGAACAVEVVLHYTRPQR